MIQTIFGLLFAAIMFVSATSCLPATPEGADAPPPPGSVVGTIGGATVPDLPTVLFGVKTDLLFAVAVSHEISCPAFDAWNKRSQELFFEHDGSNTAELAAELADNDKSSGFVGDWWTVDTRITSTAEFNAGEAFTSTPTNDSEAVLHAHHQRSTPDYRAQLTGEADQNADDFQSNAGVMTIAEFNLGVSLKLTGREMGLITRSGDTAGNVDITFEAKTCPEINQ